MRISHDKESGALYIKIRDGSYSHTEDFSENADVYVDVDAEGNVLGLEALSFEDLAQAIQEHGGGLEVPKVLSQPLRLDANSVKEAVDALDPRQQEVLKLRNHDGLTLSDVADRLGISVTEAYRIERGALDKLRMLLRADDAEESSLEALLATL